MLARLPSNSKKLFIEPPGFIGYHSAVVEGVVGGMLYLYTSMHHVVWTLPLPQDIKIYAVSQDNTRGKITNSDLEPSVEVLEIGAIIETAPEIRKKVLVTLCYNNPKFTWINNM